MDIEDLYQKHQHELINYIACITLCRDTAEDIIQECFIIFSRQIKKQQIEKPRAFLFRVAQNLAFDYLKHKKVVDKYAESSSLFLESTIEAPSVEHIMEETQLIESVKQIIDELPPRCRDAFILNKLQDMSYSEVAQHTGVSESGIEKHIMKGLKHCRVRLKNLVA